MILLPIGHEQTSVRRLPWITFAVMAICIVVFFLSGRAHLYSDDDVRATEDLNEALDYYFERPYLELDPEFEEFVFRNEGQGFEEMREILRESVMLPGPATVISEQQQLDLKCQRALKSLDSHPLARWGLVPNKLKPHTLVSHMFLHAGWLHLIGNLLILYLAGPFIEDVWGRPLYAGFFLVAGLIAGLAHVGANPGSSIPMIGASGAIAGVMGAFLIRYRTTRIRFFYMVGIIFRGTFSAPAWLMLPLWFGQQLFMAMLTSDTSAGAGVAYWAHVGGFAVGIGGALAMQQLRVEERFVEAAIADKIQSTVVDNGVVEEALEAQSLGDSEGAFQMLMELVNDQPNNHDAIVALWGVATELRRTFEVVPLILRTIRHELRVGDPDVAASHWLEVLEYEPNARAEPAVMVRLAQVLAETDREREARITLRMAMLAAGTGLSGSLALKIARLARDCDVNMARAAAHLALARRDLDPQARADAERLVTELAAAPHPLGVG